MDDRPFEFVFNSFKLRPHLLNIINNDILFCLASPELFLRKLYDIIGDMSKRLKQLKINKDQGHHDVVVRNLACGISAGNNGLKNYEKWVNLND